MAGGSYGRPKRSLGQNFLVDPNVQRKIADAVGAFPDPEMAALGQQPVLRELYRVRFQQSETWDGYRGATQDSLDVEIYEHWLASIGGASA